MTLQGSSLLSPENTAGEANSNRQRDKSVFIGMDVYGTTRVSGGVGQWQMSGHHDTCTDPC